MLPKGEIESSSDEDDQDIAQNSKKKCDFVNVSVVINSFFFDH